MPNAAQLEDEAVEGAGGICVPVNDSELTTDLINALDIDEVWLVTANYLGAISHTISAVKMCDKVSKVIINQNNLDSSVSIDEMSESLRNHLPQTICKVNYNGNSIDIIDI